MKVSIANESTPIISAPNDHKPSGDCVVPRTVRQKEAVEEKSARIKSRPVVELGVMNCRSVDNKLDYIFDHCNDNKLDIVALTETWISNDPSKSNRVVIECAKRGYTLKTIVLKISTIKVLNNFSTISANIVLV